MSTQETATATSGRRLLTGNEAAAWAARLADVDYVPAFPITPQTEIIETLALWFDSKEMSGRLTMLESEHSMITAAGAASAAGARTFTATSSQGLLFGLEMLYAVAGWRVPLVLVNVSRGLAAPITLEPDHNDVFAARDSGFLQIHCATAQEILDAILISFRWSEDRRVRLPVIVNLDGFYLSFTREPVDVPAIESVREFLPRRDDLAESISVAAPQALGSAVLSGSAYSYFRYQMDIAARASLRVFEEFARDFAERFGRRFSILDEYAMEDADIALVMVGSFATKAMAAVDALRSGGRRIGLVRPRVLRPFPRDELVSSLGRVRGVAVIDQNISPGFGGIVFGELASALYTLEKDRPILSSYIGGLGGRDVSEAEFERIVDETEEAVCRGHAHPPRLLFTEEELEAMRRRQEIAGQSSLGDTRSSGGG